MRAAALAAGTTGGAVALSIGPTCAIASAFPARAGWGPSEESQERAASIEFRSTLADGQVFGAEVIAKGDPGYAATLADARRVGAVPGDDRGSWWGSHAGQRDGRRMVERLREASW